MNNLVRAELARLRSTRAIYGWAAAAAVGVVLAVALAIQTAGQSGQAALTTNQGTRHVLAAAASNGAIAMLLGILAMAGEYRRNTITTTFLITPDRKQVVTAKLAASALVGLVLAAASSLLTVAIAVPWLTAKGVHISLLSADMAVALGGALVATALYGAIGVGVAALIPNQVIAVTVSLAWVMAVEAIVGGLLPSIGRWLPNTAASALTSSVGATARLLPVWGGGLLFAAYGAAFAVAGTRVVAHRDVT